MSKRFVYFKDLAKAYKSRGWEIEDTPEDMERLVASKLDQVEKGALLRLVEVVDLIFECVGNSYFQHRYNELCDDANRRFRIQMKELEDEFGECPFELECELERLSIGNIREHHFGQYRCRLPVDIVPPEKGTKARRMWDSWKRRARKQKGKTS